MLGEQSELDSSRVSKSESEESIANCEKFSRVGFVTTQQDGQDDVFVKNGVMTSN
jgi:hypothetical protein